MNQLIQEEDIAGLIEEVAANYKPIAQAPGRAALSR
jgi:hypothetical protein